MKPDKTMYVCEMAAATAAVAVFIAVYIVGYVQAGALATVLFAWLPAALLAWLTARVLRAAVQVVLDLAPERAFASFGSGSDDLEPIAVRARQSRTRNGRSD